MRKTENLSRLNSSERADLDNLWLPGFDPYKSEERRPRTRGECKDGERPCPWVGCRYHLAIDVKGKSIKYNHPLVDIVDMPETCALDVADRGGVADLEELAKLMNLSYDRAFQCVAEARAKVKQAVREMVGDGDGEADDEGGE